ncbi:type VII secretion integral membrane protein EccD [Corynebacterium sanguinis]|uniref:type VII secretion integral membrane protein EccD n=1 Tax=Corynebacterium sanguinis TaxID=2594913 RepID=UPI0021AF4DAC|nr:type VII secretion integral membrane protein EccD [Corynebacterium sanguinis]MCT1413470.1 type VII secretion integral membrane protein EccD [Corynebacterium sanguinis]MCT1597005.1 type VII secretion integral membrane protein EccD [Corynebacterium sanguinis]
MVATSAHHIVRVTVRIDVASFHRDIDLTLPTSSTFAEILPELARLVDLPPLSRPWEVTTVAGALLDQHRPLYQQRLSDGHIIVLRPREPVPPPVVRDAAESLAAASADDRAPQGLDIVAAAVGAAVIGLLTGLPAAAAAALFAVSILARSRALFAGFAVVAAASTGLWVGELDVALGVAAAAATLIAGAGLGVVLKLSDAPITATLATTAALLGASACAAAWLSPPTAPAAAVVLAGLGAVMFTPAVATRASGIAIPRVPTAGENFSIADTHQHDVDVRGRVARRVTAGVSAGVCLCCVPALAWLGWLGGGWVSAFSLCTGGALVLHSFRHHDTASRIALAVTAYAAVACACLAVTDNAHPVWLGFSYFLAALTLTAPLWSARVPDLEPTSLVWFERAEALAIIAVFPLGLLLMGAFDLIRGA